MTRNREIDEHALAAFVIDALNRCVVEALSELIDPEFEFHSRLAVTEGRIYRGRQGLVEYFRDLEDTFVEVRRELDEVVGWQGDDLVVVSLISGRGRASGIPFDQVTAQVWSFRGEKIWRSVTHPSKAAALEAAGRG